MKLIVSGVSPNVVGTLVPAVGASLVHAVFAFQFAETSRLTQGFSLCSGNSPILGVPVNVRTVTPY
jgi:hypothetical protein